MKNQIIEGKTSRRNFSAPLLKTVSLLIIISMMSVVGSATAKNKAVKTSWGAPVMPVGMETKDTTLKQASLAEALEQEDLVSGNNEFIITGKAKKVCAKKGCWMFIEDGSVESKVTFKDYGFFVDQSLVGKKIMARGVLTRKMMAKHEVRHELEDAGMDRKKANRLAKPKKIYAFVAEGVEIIK